MKTTKLALLGGIAIVSFAGVASAETTDYRGFYLGGFGGLAIENGQESTPFSPAAGIPIGTTSEIEYDKGFTAGGEAGWSWGNGLLTGLEYSYKSVDVDNIDPQDGITPPASGGDIKLQTIMAKATYELPLDIFGFIRPYAGAGIGAGYAEWNDMNISGFTADDSSTILAYEGFAGLAYRITPRLSATTEYRYTATDEISAETDVAAIKTKLNQGAHQFLAGLRYQFGSEVAKAAPAAAPMAPAPIAAAPAPRPAAPAPVAPAVPQTYIVFFDFDKAALTPEAQKVLERAAQDVRVGKGARIQVVGHADRSGSNSYNQRLSERRATVVKGELVRLGVNNGQIATRGAGENEPRVPTADGVREAQNRRAEIIFQ